MGPLYIYANPRHDGQCINDCYIRVVVFATGIDYETVEGMFSDKQKVLGEKYPNKLPTITAVLEDLGYRHQEVYKDSIQKSRMKVASFLKQHKGEYILKTNNHLCYVKDGILFDTWDCSNKILLGYWTKKKEETEI